MAIPSTAAGFDELNLEEALAEHRFDFDSWAILISHIENKYSDDIDKLSSVYDSFLSEFPLCCGYWSKYAAHKARLCSVEDAVEVYEKAVETASFSVDIWRDYCTFATAVFEDPFDVTRLFRRGLSYIGKDYLCYALWDKYIEFEFSQKQWRSLSQIYIEVLKFPTKKLHQYYDSFKKLVTIWEEDIGCRGDSIVKVQPETRLYEEFTAPENDELSFVISDLLESSTRSEALKKYLYIGEHFYQRASRLDNKIDCFEKSIVRTYFHVKTLDNDQLENWHHYLDFVQMNGDFDWAVKLYERCLIPCASYSEFWMRYVEYLESKGGREIANDALQRATRIFLKDLPAIHLFSAGYKEQIGDICGARTAILHIDVHSESSFLDCVMRRANMEKRLGNNVAACNVYKEALAVANREMPNTLPILYIQFSRLQYMVTSSIDVSRDILIDGVRNVVNCKQLLEELIILAMNHEAARQISILDPIVDDMIMPGSDVSRALSYKDRLEISELYLKYIDMCGTVYESRRAWERHIKVFPDSLRADPTCMQLASASLLRKILSDGSQGVTCMNPKEVGRSDEMKPSIQACEDNAQDMKDGIDECKEDDKNDGVCDIEKEQVDVAAGDESPIVDILSLDEPDTEPPYLGSASCESNQAAEPQIHSILSKADVNNSSGQEYRESPTPSYSNLQVQHSSPKRQSPIKYAAEKQKHKVCSPHHQRLSPDRHRERQERRGYGRRGRYERPTTSTSHVQAEPSSNYPVLLQQQSNEQHASLQSNEAYNQMWHSYYYYYYQQQQQLALVQQGNVQSQQEEEGSEIQQPEAAQQIQAYQYQQQQYLLYLQHLQQQQPAPPGVPSQILSPQKQEHNAACNPPLNHHSM